MNLNVLRGFFAILLFCAFACCLAIYQIWMQGIAAPSARPVTTWSPPKTETVVAFVEQLDSSDFLESFERPIFASTRRPFEPPKEEPVAPPPEDLTLMPMPEAVAPAAPDASRVVLKGVRLNAEQRQALLLSDTSPQAQWLSIGKSIDGFQLVSIDDDSVTLEAGEQKVEINLYAKKTGN